jgi:hypothetical protein
MPRSRRTRDFDLPILPAAGLPVVPLLTVPVMVSAERDEDERGDTQRIRKQATRRISRCEHVIFRAGTGVREGCDHRNEQEENRSEDGTGGGRRRAPTVLSRIRQGCPHYFCRRFAK